MWVNIFDSITAYYYALLGREAQIPPLFRAHQLSTVNFLAPGKPMMDLIENQVYLVQGDYARKSSPPGATLCCKPAMDFTILWWRCTLRCQTAAAYEALGKHAEAQTLLDTALSAAIPDQLLLPFVENFRYLPSVSAPDSFLNRITDLASMQERRRLQLTRQDSHPDGFSVLTQRELELTALMAQRLTNREIAQRLFLSEGTVKQYINQIYSKLQITGDTRTKRKELLARMQEKT